MLFSNYRTVDRRYRRFCGANAPPKEPIQSDSSFFRMRFRSNDIFDATGFFVYYQFLDQRKEKKPALLLRRTD